MPARERRRDKGAGSITKTKNGRYRAFVETSPDPATGERRRISATGKNRTEALKKAKEKLRQVEDDPLAWHRMPTVAEWCLLWLKTIVTPRRTPNTTRSYRFAITNRIIPIIGALPLNGIRPSHIRLLEHTIVHGDPKRDMKPRSQSTAFHTWCVLNSALDAAVNEGILERNPMKGCEPPMKNESEIQILTPLQASRLIRMEPDPQWRLIWRMLYVTGMRLGEILGMTADEITIRDGITIITVEWQLQRFDGIADESQMPGGYTARHITGRMWLARPKTRNGRRIIPLPDDLASELHAHMKRTGRTGAGMLIFLTRRGNPIGRSVVHPAWDHALERAGLPHVRIHSARHTTATMLATLNVSDAYREAIIGHASAETTNRVYTHMQADQLERILDTVGMLLESPDASPENASTVVTIGA